MKLPHILIPVKSLSEGKSRLAAVLSREQRRSLNEWLIRRTIAIATEFAGRAQCAVVSPCPEVLRLAHACGVHPFAQWCGGGMNAGVQGGLEQLRARGAGEVLVVACDLPLLAACDLEEVVVLGRTRGALVVGADRHGKGTNLLFMPAAISIRLRYGEGSLERHLAEAERAGCPGIVYRSDSAGFDLDTPPDLAQWRSQARSPFAADFVSSPMLSP